MPKGRQEHFDSYRGLHQPSGDPGDPAIHNMETLFPDDVYTHPHFYGHGDKVVDREAGRALQGAKGDPEAMVDIYRGVPHGVSSINQGVEPNVWTKYRKWSTMNSIAPGWP